MLRLLVTLYVFIVVTVCDAQPKTTACAGKDSMHWAPTTLGCLHFNVYKSEGLTNNPTLVIVLHGDAPFNKPGYQYATAKIIAGQNKNTIAVGMLRPGYTDPDGNRSAGTRGLTTGDNYTPENINAIAEVIAYLKKLYHPSKTILAGHSGGSAITADIIGVQPLLVDDAVIVSCPCNVPQWRDFMSKKQPGYTAWRNAVSSISPNTVADKVDKHTKVVIISGSDDDVAPTQLSVDYYNQLKKRGIDCKLIQIPGEKHEILLHDTVFATIKTLIGH